MKSRSMRSSVLQFERRGQCLLKVITLYLVSTFSTSSATIMALPWAAYTSSLWHRVLLLRPQVTGADMLSKMERLRCEACPPCAHLRIHKCLFQTINR
jgi:hypothetical protein